MYLITSCLSFFILFVPLTSAQAPSDSARHALEGLITDVTKADYYVYGLKDDNGNQMACVKVIQDSSGSYLAVSHSNPPSLGGVFAVALQNSTDLKKWHFVRQLGQHASQPYIFEDSRGGYIVTWEQDPNNHIQFRYFSSHSNLINGIVSQQYNAPQTLSTCAEGTPNIYSVTFHSSPPNILDSTVQVGGHYYQNCQHDRQQAGVLTNFNSWVTHNNDDINNAILYWKVLGNIGARDFTYFSNYMFGLVEGMYVEGDFCSWKMFMFDYQTHNADILNITTHAGSKSFGNPRITSLKTPEGKMAIAVSYFLFCANGGEGGPLFYYKLIN